MYYQKPELKLSSGRLLKWELVFGTNSVSIYFHVKAGLEDIFIFLLILMVVKTP